MALGKEHICHWEIPVWMGSILGAWAFCLGQDHLDFYDVFKERLRRALVYLAHWE